MRKILKEAKGFIVGFTCCAVLTSGVAYAAGGTQIEVYYNNLKYMIDGVEKSPTEGKGFIYDGTTYVPLRFIGEALGKEVSYDGSTSTIWVGKREGAFTYLTDIEYARMNDIDPSDLYFDKTSGGKLKIAGTTFKKGFSAFISFGTKKSIEYNLDGKYSKLTGLAGMDDLNKNSTATGTIKIFGDGKELYSFNKIKGGDHPTNVDIDVKGVLKLKIQLETDKDVSRVDFVEPKLYQ